MQHRGRILRETIATPSTLFRHLHVIRTNIVSLTEHLTNDVVIEFLLLTKIVDVIEKTYLHREEAIGRIFHHDRFFACAIVEHDMRKQCAKVVVPRSILFLITTEDDERLFGKVRL